MTRGRQDVGNDFIFNVLSGIQIHHVMETPIDTLRS